MRYCAAQIRDSLYHDTNKFPIGNLRDPELGNLELVNLCL